MKGIVLFFSLIAISAISFSQNCSQVTSGSITKLTGNNYRLTINYLGTGSKHTNVILFDGPISVANYLLATCANTPNSGSTIIDFTSISSPIAVLAAGSGVCGGNLCLSLPVFVSYTGGSGPLPILISSFNAKRNNTIVTLNWKTLMEVNSKEFIVQRNTGNGYVDVKTIPTTARANGDVYTTTDNNLTKGTTTYRLKLVDVDGTYTFSDIRAVKGISAPGDFTLYPNPAQQDGKVMITDISEPTQVQIIDYAGRVLKTVTLDGNNTVDLANIQNGVYMLRIVTKSSGTIITRKLTVSK